MLPRPLPTGLVWLAFAGAASAQTIEGRVKELGTGTAVAGAWVTAFDARGVPVAVGQFSDRTGLFVLEVPLPGRYRVRVEALGFEPAELDPVAVGATDPVSLEVRLQPSPIGLEPVEVEAPALTLREELTLRGVRRRRALAPGAGPARGFMQGDPEMRSATDVGDILRWVAGGQGCTTYFINGFRTQFPVGDLPISMFEAVEAYRRPDLVPAVYKTEAMSCGVVAIWTRPPEAEGARRWSMGRALVLFGAIAGALLLAR